MESSQRSSSRRPSSQEVDSQLIEEKIVKPNGDIAVKSYNKGRFLGKGGFARVYEFTCMDNKHVSASKVIPKAALSKARAKQKLMSEIKIHRALHQTNIVGFEHFFEDQENVYILLELCPNQTLNELLRRRKRLTELETVCYAHQAIQALKYLHSHRVIHRDIKLGNLFISGKMELKLGDFGLATKLEFDGERKRTICGTPNYIAPEVLDGKHGHSYEVDIWSLGVVIYTLLVGKPPFETSDVKTTYKRIKMNAYSFPDHIPLSNEARGLITRILHSEPTKRPSLDDMLAHEFFTKFSSIPKLLPTSTLAVPPSRSYVDEFMAQPKKSSVDASPAASIIDERASRRDMVSSARFARSTSQPTMRDDQGTTGRQDIRQEAKQEGKPEARQDGRPDIRQDARTSPPKLSATGRAAASSAFHPNPSQPEGPDLWVIKWVDYSSKYGLGYLLSNGATGVYFNDSSKVVFDPSSNTFDYIERRSSDKQESVETHSLTLHPPSLQKKITLLQHFRNYLEGTSFPPAAPLPHPLPYVKKWMATEHAIIFRLSNKVVQVCFLDRTELILSSESKLVMYVNKRGERSVHSLSSAMESSNAEMTKRLKYTKDMLARMLQGSAHTGGTTERRPPTERN